MVGDINEEIRFHSQALLVLQEAAEQYLTGVFEDCRYCASHARRVTIQPKDVRFVCYLLKIDARPQKLPEPRPSAALPLVSRQEAGGTEAVGTAASAMDWQSSLVLPCVSRPWNIFHCNLEDKRDELEKQDSAADPSIRDELHSIRDVLDSIKIKGVYAVFVDLPADQRRPLEEIALNELSAYARWRASLAANSNPVPSELDLAAAWEKMDCDQKAAWVPTDPRGSLAADAIWASLVD